MKIVAFLQNQWFKDPEGVKAMLARHDNDVPRRERVRRRLIHYALFAGCLTGRRIKRALGQEICNQIVWEEASRVIAGDAKTFHPPEIEHVRSVVIEQRPDVVILFGASNVKLVPQIAGIFSGLTLTAPHPAARGAHIPAQLKTLGDKLRQLTSDKDDIISRGAVL